MINVGSISDQTLGGIITTATHGSGADYGVMSTQVRGLKILLANGRSIVCSRTQDSDLFIATLCGIGATGIVLEVLLDVEPAFRLKEVQEPMMFDDMVKNIDVLIKSAQHVRFWWFPATDKAVYSSADRTYDVSLYLSISSVPDVLFQPPKPAGSWFWSTFFGYHVVQLLLFLGMYLPFLNIWTQYLAFWLVNKKSEGTDEGHRIFNVDCRVRYVLKSSLTGLIGDVGYSIHNSPPNGRFHSLKLKLACMTYALGSNKNFRTAKD